MNVLTIVSASVAEEVGPDLRDAFAELVASGLPPGLIETRLLDDGHGTWAIHSLWRDRAALDEMRASGEPPAAPALFARFGAQPSLTVMDVVGYSSRS